MGLLDGLTGMLTQYASGTAAPDNVATHFGQVAQVADPATLAHGIAAALQTDQPFGAAVTQLFGNATPDQKAGMVNALLSSAPPDLRAEISGLVPGAAGGAVTGAQAAGVSSSLLGSLATRVQQQGGNGVVEKMSAFYAQHPTLVQTLGSAAMMVAMRKIAERHLAA